MIFFWGRKKKKEDISKSLNDIWSKLKDLYKFTELSDKQKEEISNEIALKIKKIYFYFCMDATLLKLETP